MEKEISVMQAPNREYLEFSFVGETATGKGNNQQFVMQANADGSTFKCTEGRIGIRVGANKPRVWNKPMSEWDETYSFRIQKGWLLTKQQRMEKKTIKHQNYKQIEEESVREFVQYLLDAAQKLVDDSYTVKVDDISDEMLNMGRELIKQISHPGNISVAAYNNLLKRLYAVIPRRINNLSANLAKREKDFGAIADREAEMLDVIVNQLRATKITEPDKTITQANGLDWREVNEEEKKEIINLLAEKNRGAYINAWRVNNHATDKAFDDFCNPRGFTEESGDVKLLFHGSKTANFWSIATQGLLLNPDAPITGKAFGYGIYFAPSSSKSLGYTSGMGSYWAKGADSTAVLAIYKVATGKPYYCYRDPQVPYSLAGITQLKRDCLWAEGQDTLGSNAHYLRHDEVIIYRQEQCTLKYLITMDMSRGY